MHMESVNRWVHVKPVEVVKALKHGCTPSIRVRSWKLVRGRYFKSLTPEKLKEALRASHVKLENIQIITNPSFIIYQYKGKPLIALNVRDGRFYTTELTLEKWGQQYVQYQCFILMSILVKNGLSDSKLSHSKYCPLEGR